MSQSTGKTPSSTNETVYQQLSVAKTLLRQAVDLVDNHLTGDDQLSIHSQYLPGSTIGKHLRHARDHFVLLLDCIVSPPPYILSYDVRIRNTPMETSCAGAKEALLDTIARLDASVPGAKLGEPVTLYAITPYMHQFQSTLGREVSGLQPDLEVTPAELYLQLWFASLHCVHHWSMVRVIAGEMVSYLRYVLATEIQLFAKGIKLTDDFGFAPSTLVYQGDASSLLSNGGA